MKYQGEDVDVIRILVRQFYHEVDMPFLHNDEGELVVRFRVKATNYSENERTGEMVCTQELKVLDVEVEDA